MLGKQIGLTAVVLAALVGCVPVVSVPPPPTAEERQVLYDEMLDRTWISTGLSERMARPAIRAESPLGSDAWGQAIADCMAEEGYLRVEFHWEPSRGYYLDAVRQFAPLVPDESELRFFVCVSRYPLDLLSTESLSTPAELEFQYENYQRRVLPCLLVNGVPVSSTVTREQFVETQGSWSPYQQLSAAARTSPGFDRLVGLCGG